MKTSDFDYHLPVEFIAQRPLEQRDHSRLLVLDRKKGSIQHSSFQHLRQYLNKGDLLVLNETRVILARIYASKLPGGGKVELLLLNQLDDLTWQVMVGGKGLVVGRKMSVEGGPGAEVVASLSGPRREIRFDEPIEPYLPQIGQVPLPPYIKTPLRDPERYQTVYARRSGSAAAPTAGLHFTKEMIDRLTDQGLQFASVTLHVGLDTFAPVTADDPREHAIHTEWCQLSQKTAQKINQVKGRGGRIIAVGTTSVRTLESAAHGAIKGKVVAAFEGSTDLFILPGYEFQVVDAMITNFHLPRSTLIMLVSAFAGRETILDVYHEAMSEGYRFYSFGDAMLIV